MKFRSVNKNLLSFSILLLILASGCSKKEKDPLKKYGTFVSTVIKVDTGAFRGLNFGDKLETVLLKESAKASEADENYLYFEYKIDTMGSFDIAYDFDEEGISEILSYVYIKDIGKIDSVFNSFKTYFDDHYGTNETQMGYNVWTVKSQGRGDIHINLSDESANFTTDGAPGKLYISIYSDKN
jgi:hypothetical protein